MQRGDVPAWMEQSIDEALAPYADGIRRQDIDEAEQSLNEAFHDLELACARWVRGQQRSGWRFINHCRAVTVQRARTLFHWIYWLLPALLPTHQPGTPLGTSSHRCRAGTGRCACTTASALTGGSSPLSATRRRRVAGTTTHREPPDTLTQDRN